MYVLKKQEP